MEKIDTEIIHKEIDLIQACISRMAYNSFLVKGWAISLVAVVLAIADIAKNPLLLSVTLLIPLISFWYLDAFFLLTEKMYRAMYCWILKERKQGNDEYLYDLNPHRFKDKVESTLQVMLSVTLRCFYGIPFIIILAIIICQLNAQVVKNNCGKEQCGTNNSGLNTITNIEGKN